MPTNIVRLMAMFAQLRGYDTYHWHGGIQRTKASNDAEGTKNGQHDICGYLQKLQQGYDRKTYWKSVALPSILFGAKVIPLTV